MSTTSARWRDAAGLLQLEAHPFFRAVGTWVAAAADTADTREPHQSEQAHAEYLRTGGRAHVDAVVNAYLPQPAERSTR